MSEQDEATKQANAGADNTANQINNDLDVTEDQLSAIQDENARKTLASTAAQKKHWRDKAKTLEARVEELTKQVTEKTESKKASNDSIDPEQLKRELKEDLKLEMAYPDLDDADMRKAKLLAKDEGKTVYQVIADPFFQSYLKQKSANIAAELATGDPSNRGGSATHDWSAYEKKPELVKTLDPAKRKQFTKWLEAKAR